MAAPGALTGSPAGADGIGGPGAEQAWAARARCTTTTYDDDILLWSEQQAELIRSLAGRRDLPDAFDAENVAEEIASVGRSELAAVKGLIRRLLIRVMMLTGDPDAAPVRHWRAEIVGFHGDMLRRYAPSMRQRIDLDALWRSARQQVALAYEGTPQQDAVAALPDAAPLGLDDLLAAPPDVAGLVRRVQAAVRA
ncbi:DUF29 domain-containing protein [Rhodoplanes roseus]|uniref:DUF29 domain-containing protein n=1 Tax=Rhodoplanes roseus TaxID=29409 RepID=UPI001474C588|nr:DUF29 domain-containing protein [Rhodoplanes roseus]